jgi:hypothetical protein
VGRPGGRPVVGRPRTAVGAGARASAPPPTAAILCRATRQNPGYPPPGTVHRYALQGDEPPAHRLRLARHAHVHPDVSRRSTQEFARRHLIVRSDRRGLARPSGTGYQDRLRRGRAALSRVISPTSLRYRSASRTVPRKPCRTPDRGERSSKRTSENHPATPRVPAAAPDRTSPHRGGRR